MKRILLSILVIGILLLGACGAPTEAPPTPANERELIQELWQSLMDYNAEFGVAEMIFREDTNHAGELLQAGQITTLELRKRCYQFTLIYAHTIKFIDSKPEYFLLNDFMWHRWNGDGTPELGHRFPELEGDKEKAEAEYEMYLEQYIGVHSFEIEEFSKFLMEQADELGIELAWTPKL